MQQLQGQHGVNLGRIVAATLQVTVDHRLEAFSFDVRPGQRARIQEHVANVSGQDIAVPDADGTGGGPQPNPPPSRVIGRYAYAVYDEGGLLDLNVAGFPTYASAGPGPAQFIAKVTPELGEILRASYTIPTPARKKTAESAAASRENAPVTVVKANASKITSPPLALGKVGSLLAIWSSTIPQTRR